ncbi:polyprenyl synthetase family protein [soil metagenome]
MSVTAPPPLALADLLAPIADDMKEVDRVIRRRLSSDIALINTVADYIIAAGGKRLRPALLLLVAQALGHRGPHRHEMAAVIEFIHTATLLHDDVVDESSLRRGRSTANEIFGNAAAVLVGDFLYSRSFQMMLVPGEFRIMAILADATNLMSEGEVLQLMNAHDPDVSEERYLQVIRSKTACLFEASARLAAVLAGSDEVTEEACAAYGRHLGTAFQLVDDALDYSSQSDAIGKNVGDDLREGKPTMPLIYLREKGSPADRALVRTAIEQGDADAIGEVIAALDRVGAIEYTRSRAEREAALAAKAIERLPDSEAKRVLLHLCAFSSSRSQ